MNIIIPKYEGSTLGDYIEYKINDDIYMEIVPLDDVLHVDIYSKNDLPECFTMKVSEKLGILLRFTKFKNWWESEAYIQLKDFLYEYKELVFD